MPVTTGAGTAKEMAQGDNDNAANVNAKDTKDPINLAPVKPEDGENGKLPEAKDAGGTIDVAQAKMMKAMGAMMTSLLEEARP